MHTQRKDHVRTTVRGSPSISQGQRPQKIQTYRYLGLVFQSSRYVRKSIYVFKPPSLQCFCMAQPIQKKSTDQKKRWDLGGGRGISCTCWEDQRSVGVKGRIRGPKDGRVFASTNLNCTPLACVATPILFSLFHVIDCLPIYNAMHLFLT